MGTCKWSQTLSNQSNPNHSPSLFCASAPLQTRPTAVLSVAFLLARRIQTGQSRGQAGRGDALLRTANSLQRFPEPQQLSLAERHGGAWQGRSARWTQRSLNALLPPSAPEKTGSRFSRDGSAVLASPLKRAASRQSRG